MQRKVTLQKMAEWCKGEVNRGKKQAEKRQNDSKHRVSPKVAKVRQAIVLSLASD